MEVLTLDSILILSSSFICFAVELSLAFSHFTLNNFSVDWDCLPRYEIPLMDKPEESSRF